MILEKNSVKDRPLNITWAEKSNTREVDEVTMSKVKTLYVSNLNISASEHLLFSVFQPYGNLINVVIIRNPSTKQSRGFAFIEYEKRENALSALQYLNGRELLGQVMNITLAVPAPPKSKKSKPSQNVTDFSPKSSQKHFGNAPRSNSTRFHPYYSYNSNQSTTQQYEDPSLYYHSNYYNSQLYDPTSYYSHPYSQDYYTQ